MSKPRDIRHKDLFRPTLDENIDLVHLLPRVAEVVDRAFLGARFTSVRATSHAQPPLASRRVEGLFILKCMHGLADEMLRARWVSQAEALDQTDTTPGVKSMKTAYAPIRGFEIMRLFRKGQCVRWFYGEMGPIAGANSRGQNHQAHTQSLRLNCVKNQRDTILSKCLQQCLPDNTVIDPTSSVPSKNS